MAGQGFGLRGKAIAIGLVGAAAIVAGAGETASAELSGHLTKSVPGSNAQAAGAVTQEDGGIVVAGLAERRGRERVLLTRFLPGGRPDPAFRGGRMTADLGDDAGAYAITAQPDGKLIVAGTIERHPSRGKRVEYDFVVARFLPDGTLDTSFGEMGRTSIDFGGEDFATAVAVDDAGRVLVAGARVRSTSLDIASKFALTRLDSNGVVDAGFGNAGKTVTSVGGLALPTSVAGMPDGDVVAAGIQVNLFGEFFEDDFVDTVAIARYTPAGAPDLGFGASGVEIRPLTITTPPRRSSVETFVNDVAVGTDGSVSAGGATFIFARRESIFESNLARFAPSGRPDPAFGGDGYVTLPEGTVDPTVVAPQGDGSLWVAGNGSTRRYRLALTRVTPSGVFDAGFGDGGLAPIPFNGNSRDVSDVTTDSTGRIIASGVAGGNFSPKRLYNPFSPFRIGLARYTPSGSLDPDFGRHVPRHPNGKQSSADRPVQIEPPDRSASGIAGPELPGPHQLLP